MCIYVARTGGIIAQIRAVAATWPLILTQTRTHAYIYTYIHIYMYVYIGSAHGRNRRITICCCGYHCPRQTSFKYSNR